MTVFVGNDHLLRRFRAGDREALGTVYWHYVDAVEALLRRCLASRAGAMAHGKEVADVLQDVFVKAFSESARLAFDESREYRPFLMVIARHTLIDHLRVAPREISLDAAAIDALVDTREGHEQDSGPWGEPQTMALVEKYIEELDEHQRAVYVERYVRCRSQEHTAEALGTSRQRVRTLENKLRIGLSRALARLRLAAGVSSSTRLEAARPSAIELRRQSPP